jgi:hypothetical protein
MNRRDRGVVAVLVLILAVFAGALALPRQAAPVPSTDHDSARSG